MGRKSSTTYTSKGQRRNVAKSTCKAMCRDYIENQLLRRAINQYDAYCKSKRVMITIANPNKNETRSPFIRVNARVKHNW
jgi:hypothetical protein